MKIFLNHPYNNKYAVLFRKVNTKIYFFKNVNTQ